MNIDGGAIASVLVSFLSQQVAKFFIYSILFYILSCTLLHRLPRHWGGFAHFVLGLVQCIILFKWDTGYLIVMALVCYLCICRGGPVLTTIVSSVFVLVGHGWNDLIRGKASWALDASGVVMMMCMKTISLAFNIDDGTDKEKVQKRWPQTRASAIDMWICVGVDRAPSLVDFLGYSFTPVGSVSGPWFEYVVFEQMLSQRLPKPGSWKRLVYALVHAGFVQVFLKFATWDNTYGSVWWSGLHPLVRSLVVPVISAILATRYFPAWLLMDAITQELGAWDGTPVAADEVSNGDWPYVLAAHDVQQWYQRWNHTAHCFFKNYLYTRVVHKTGRTVGGALVYLMSITWHGFKPNYFLILPELLLIEWADKRIHARFGPYEGNGRLGRVVRSLLVWEGQLYMCAAWWFPRVWQGWTIRRDVWFAPVILYVVIGCVLVPKRQPRAADARKQPGGEGALATQHKA